MNKLFIIAAFLVLCSLFLTALADNKQDGIDYYKKKEQEEGYVKTASGLLYKIHKAGTGSKHPSKTDKVEVHYEGTLVDGQVFDSSIKRGQTITFGLNQVIPCWTEGLQLATIGAKLELICPSEIAYGAQSMSIIKPHSTLIFNVELFAINGKKDEL